VPSQLLCLILRTCSCHFLVRFKFLLSIFQDEDNGFFIQEIKRLEGQVVELEVFNAKAGQLRGVYQEVITYAVYTY
jgi:hypothetical protein